MSVSDSVSAYGLELLPHERVATVRGLPIDLTAREFDILLHLATHPGWVYSADQLADGDEESPDSSPDSVRVHIAHMRHKLSLAGAGDIIGTVRGVGYRLQRGSSDGGDAHTEPSACAPRSDPTPAKEPPRTVSRELRDSFWLLERTVIELEQTATKETLRAAVGALDDARRAVARLLGAEAGDAR